MIAISTELSGIIEGKEKIPISRVEVYDTTNTVPSSGWFVQYYSGVDVQSTGDLKRTQFEPMIYNDWSSGMPAALSNYLGANISQSGLITTDSFSVKYSGWFFAEEAGLYDFATKSTGGTEIFVKDVQILSGTQQITPTTSGYSSGVWDGKQRYWNGSSYLDIGWHPIKVNFFWPFQQGSGNLGNPMLSAFYTSPNPSIPERVLSASVVSPYPAFIQPTTYSHVMKISQADDEEATSRYSFEVATITTGQYQWSAADQNFGDLKSNRLVKVYMGYATIPGYNLTSGYTVNLTGTSDFVHKFTGMIDTVKVNQKSKSRTATVSCRDFGKKLINTINSNFPNRASYTQPVVSEVDPYGIFDIENAMPNAYDNWTVFDVATDLCLQAAIDPVHLDRNRWDTKNYFKLESNLNWPTTTVTDLNGIQTKDADPFIFSYEYGEPLYDLLKRTTDLVGFKARFNAQGNLLINEPRFVNKIEVYETGNYGQGAVSFSDTADWDLQFDVNTANRVFWRPFVGGSLTQGTMEVTFSGVGASIFHTVFPSGERVTAEIRRTSDDTLMTETTFTSSGTLAYKVKEEITSSLAYDGYTMRIRPSGDFRAEQFESYSDNIFKPKYIIREGQDISNIDVDLNDDSVRNEIITVGQQRGDKAYLYSKALDIGSVSNPDAFNYVGEKKTLTIIEPTIHSQDRLDWLAANILERYRRKQRNITVSCQGLPHLEVGDPVGLEVAKLNVESDSAGQVYDINNNDVFYVRRINSSLSKGKYTTNIALTTLKPIEPWTPPIGITIDVLQTIYEANDNSIFANFRQLTLNAPPGKYGYDGFSEQAAFVDFDLLVDVDRLWVLIADETDGGEIFRSIDIRDPTPQITWLPPGGGPNEEPQGAVWLHNGGGERWGKVTVPTAQNNFNGGQWVGQNSESNVRNDGAYPIAIWAQFRTADQALYYQGVWVPTSGTLDNRNRVLSNTNITSSDTNVFYAYTFNDQQQALATPINSGVDQAYLPAFAVGSERLKVDMWMGPKASGYQMVSQNVLQDMSSQFDNHGEYYSQMPDPRSGFTGLTQFPLQHGIITYRPTNVPWAAGDDILFDGPSEPDPHVRYAEAFNKFKPLTDPSIKKTFGWTPQGWDIPALKPSYMDANVVWTNGLSQETIFHPYNYVTIETNHDVVLSYKTWHMSNKLEGGWSFQKILVNEAVFTIPFRGPLSLYLNDVRGLTNVVPGLPSYRPDINYVEHYYTNQGSHFNYTGTNNVVYPREAGGGNGGAVFAFIQGLNGEYLNEYNLVHQFELMETKSGKKYNFTMRSQSFFPRGNSPYTSYSGPLNIRPAWPHNGALGQIFMTMQPRGRAIALRML